MTGEDQWNKQINKILNAPWLCLKEKNIQFYFWFLFLYSKPMIYYQQLEAISQRWYSAEGVQTHMAHILSLQVFAFSPGDIMLTLLLLA